MTLDLSGPMISAREREGAIPMGSVRFSVLVSALLAAGLLLALPVYADQVTVFSLITNYPPPQAQQPDGTASGTVTIDTTTGVIEAIDLSFAGEPSITFSSTLWDVFGNPPDSFVELGESWTTPQNGFYDVVIDLPVATLVGYAGGSICTAANPCPDGAFSGFTYGDSAITSYTSGDLSPVPEPASWTLLGAAVLGSVGMLRRTLAR